jgi:RND family efflux transporter MFP subunit
MVQFKKAGSNFLIIAVVLMIAFLAGCGRSDTDEVTGVTWVGEMPPKPTMAVDALEIVSGKLMPVVETSGVVEGINQAVVVSRTQGRIVEVLAEIGDSLEMDSPLLKVDDSVAGLNLQQAREQMENARINLGAQESLRSSGGATEADLLRARSAYRGAQALYETSLKAFEDTTLKSPIAGVLAWKAADLEVGNYLAPGQPVYRVADLSGLRFTLSVGERQVSLIEPGAAASITIPSALGVGELKGRVTAVGAGSDLATGSYVVIVEADNPYDLSIKAGMTASVRIATNDPRQGIIVPFSSLVNREGESYLYVEEEGQVAARKVDYQTVLGNRLLVTQGVSEGENLIISGISSLKPGDPVSIRVKGTSEGGI